MALDTFIKIAGEVLLRCPSAGPLLARSWVSHAFRELAERRVWSWLLSHGQLIFPAVYNTGTVTVTLNSTTVTGSGTTFTSAMEGRQFRTGVSSPIYTVQSVTNATSLELDIVWGAATASAQSYEIYQAYVTPPSDFLAWVAVTDPSNNWRLHLNVEQELLNRADAQRSASGTPYVLSPVDYSTTRSGTVGDVTQVRGSGPKPSLTADSVYDGPNDALYVVDVVLGGITGTATFRWKKDEGSYNPTVTTAATEQGLAEGLSVYWPTGATYVAGDVFAIRVYRNSAPNLPRYEVYPHVKTAMVLPYMYETRATDLEDSGAVLPRYVRGDVLLERALAAAAKWPGPSESKPNPYAAQWRAQEHGASAEKMYNVLEVQDDEVRGSMVSYLDGMSYAPVPWADAGWLQSHTVF